MLSGESPVAYEVTEEGEIRLNLDPAPDVGGLIGQILGIINQAQTTDQWRRLNICAAHTHRKRQEESCFSVE